MVWFVAVVAAVVLGSLALPVLILVLSNRSDRAAEAHVRAVGTLCVAFVKSYRRISMTQHRVLFEIQLPTGAIGREYVLSGLPNAWLADVTALGRPVQVYAHSDARTIAFA